MYHAVGVSPKAKFDLESLGAELLRAKLLSPPTPTLKPLIVENNNMDSGGGKATTAGPNTARCETRSVVLLEALAYVLGSQNVPLCNAVVTYGWKLLRFYYFNDCVHPLYLLPPVWF